MPTAPMHAPRSARNHHYAAADQGETPRRLLRWPGIETAKTPILYTGGGVINSGPEASNLLRELAAETDFPITSTLMGLGAYPASGDNWLGMLGMHGLYRGEPGDARLRPDDLRRRAV